MVRSLQIPSRMGTVAFESLNSIRGKKVLVVDDNSESRQFLNRVLDLFGCEVDFATNGAEAVEQALAGDHDVVLMDLCMPVLNGQSATKQLRDAGYTRPIVGVTAEAKLVNAEDIEEIGFDECLFKPVNRIKLVTLISELT